MAVPLPPPPQPGRSAGPAATATATTEWEGAADRQILPLMRGPPCRHLPLQVANSKAYIYPCCGAEIPVLFSAPAPPLSLFLASVSVPAIFL